MKTRLIAATAALALSSASQAVVLAEYNFTTASTASSIAASTTATDVTAGNFTANGNTIAQIGISTAGNAYLRSNDSESLLANTLTDMVMPTLTDDYFQVTFSAAPGMTLDLDNLTFLLGHTTDNADSFTSTAVLSSSVNGFGTAITGTGGISRTTAVTTTSSTFNASAASYDLSTPEYQGLSTITFRLSVFDDRNENAKITRFDTFTLNGDVNAIPEPSAALLGGLGLLCLLRRRR